MGSRFQAELQLQTFGGSAITLSRVRGHPPRLAASGTETQKVILISLLTAAQSPPIRLSHETFVHELPPARTDRYPNWQSDQCFSVVPGGFGSR
jgi:hypothetical protein